MLTPWKKSYDQPRQHIEKQRHYFANKGLSSQGYGFSCGPVWMWELDCDEGWAPKNWCFWTVVLENTRPPDLKGLLRVPWTARRSNQSILSPGISLEGLMLKLKLQYFGHLMRRVDWLEKTLMLGGIGGRRGMGQQRVRLLDGITDLMDMSLSELPEMVLDREAWCAVIFGVSKSRTRLSNWTELNWTHTHIYIYIWNLERWYLWIYLQGSNGETDTENRLMDMGWGRETRERNVWWE